jgi:pimeloyl-ACP methyl ester carboxylesterase
LPPQVTVALDAALLDLDRVAGLVLIGTAVSAAPEPDLDTGTQRFDARLDPAIAAGNLEEVNRLETWLWLDGHPRLRTVACGERDVPFLLVRSRELAGRLPNGCYRELPGVAHQPYLEQPAQVADLVVGALHGD